MIHIHTLWGSLLQHTAEYRPVSGKCILTQLRLRLRLWTGAATKIGPGMVCNQHQGVFHSPSLIIGTAFSESVYEGRSESSVSEMEPNFGHCKQALQNLINVQHRKLQALISRIMDWLHISCPRVAGLHPWAISSLDEWDIFCQKASELFQNITNFSKLVHSKKK